jgi:hypothetical protein
MGLLFIPQMIYENGEPQWNNIDRVKPSNLKKNLSHYTLSNTNPTRIDPGTSMDLCGERPVTNHLSHSMA